jgi:hypothetical protein
VFGYLSVIPRLGEPLVVTVMAGVPEVTAQLPSISVVPAPALNVTSPTPYRLAALKSFVSGS